MIGHGVSSRSSHSWAAGRMTCSAKSCTHFWICELILVELEGEVGHGTPPGAAPAAFDCYSTVTSSCGR